MSSASFTKSSLVNIQTKSALASQSLIYHKKDLIRANITLESGIHLLEQLPADSQPSESVLDVIYNCCKGQDTPPYDESIIPFKYVINAEPIALTETDSEDDEQCHLVEVTYALPFKDKERDLKISKVKLEIENKNDLPPSIPKFILSSAYNNSIARPSVLVLINPHGGKGQAKSIYKKEILPVLQAAKVKITYVETQFHGHATQVARDLDVDLYDIIVCCSGDGIPHEVINGFYSRPDKGVLAFNKVAVTQLPCGSGNALSLSTHGTGNASVATFQMLKAHRAKMDLMAVTQGTGPTKTTKLSFLSQCYGVIADSDIGTEHLRWLGPIRFEIGVAQKVFSGATYPCDLFVKYKIDNKAEIINHVNDYLTNHSSDGNDLPEVTEENLRVLGPDLSHPVPQDWTRIPDHLAHNLNILYVGNMPYVSADAQFFPAALPSDGAMDMILTDSTSSAFKTASILMAVEKGTHIDDERVHHSKVSSYRLIPNVRDHGRHYISIDGENFPFEAFQVEVLPGVLTVLLQDGNFVETSVTK
ncbi:Sphingoid long chain base kinase 4 [Candida viswanathii]|uniref:Sphingoid long chain base kinase 4 n=1 Tax=Candida viswanathii TaxID=5486 RepID=A0A367YDC4_9ASCO|nr:Sphingoid long chain base kinase 4 [Candida viswanathii]